MKKVLTFILLLFLVTESFAQLHFTRAVALSHDIGELTWSQLPQVERYDLYRRYPSQTSFSLLASLADTHYTDTLRRVVCADTVSYLLMAQSGSTIILSDTAGIPYRDDVPTAPCSLRLCTVDTLTSRLMLSWYPSPDTDVMGYYICIGSPCQGFDTVWGRLNCSYLCPEEFALDPAAEHSFRILAFDSCYQASPLSSYYHNPIITFDDPGCTRRLTCRWNRYINMPDSVARYVLHYRFDGSDTTHTFQALPDGPFMFDTMISQLSYSSLTAWLSVHGPSDSLVAYSKITRFSFPTPASARYLRIAETRYDESEPAIDIAVEVDTAFAFNHCYLYRSQGASDTGYIFVADLHSVPLDGTLLRYHDTDINRAALVYRYIASMPDACEQRKVTSEVVTVTLPEVLSPTIFAPNVIIYGSAEHGHFCPEYLSPLADGYDLAIFDRRGLRVFHTTQLHDCWDGTTPSGQPLSQGTYVYRAHCRHADGSEHTYKGTLLLLH